MKPTKRALKSRDRQIAAAESFREAMAQVGQVLMLTVTPDHPQWPSVEIETGMEMEVAG